MDRKQLNKVSVVLLLICFSIGAGRISGQEKSSKESRIVFEKFAVIKSKSGKEIEKIFTKDAKEGYRILDEIKKKGLEKDEKVEVIEIKSPRIKFVNENGNSVKEIPLGLEIRKVKKKIQGLDKEKLIEEILSKSAEVSKNGRFVAVIENLTENIIPEMEDEKKKMDGTDIGYLSSTARIKYFNEEGNILWEKKAPKNMAIGNVMMSHDGEVIAFIQKYVMGGLDKNEPYEKFVVLNKAGQELFKLPEKREDKYHGLILGCISPKGRYVSIGGFVGYGKGSKSFALFLDLQNKTSWKAPSKYNPYKIEDNGVAYTSCYDEKEKKIKSEIIDLKDVLK